MTEAQSYLIKVAANIKTRRISLGLTQEDMEEGKYGINARTFQRLENGETDISITKLFLIAKTLHTSPKDLLDV